MLQNSVLHQIKSIIFSAMILLVAAPSAYARFEDWRIDFENNNSLIGAEGDTLYLAPVPGMTYPTPTGTNTNDPNWVPQTTTQTSTSERELLIEMLRDLKDARDKQQAEYDDSDSDQYQKEDTKKLIDQMNLQITNLQNQIDTLAGETVTENLTCSAYCAQKRDQLELILKDVVCMSIPSCAQCRLAFSAMVLDSVETNTLHIGELGQRCNAYQQSTKALSESRNLSRHYHFAFATCALSCGVSLGIFSDPFCDFLDFGITAMEIDAARNSLNEAAATDPEVIDAIKSLGGGRLFQDSVSKKTQGSLTEEIINEAARKKGIEFAVRKLIAPGPCAAAAYIMWRMLQAVDGRSKIQETKTEVCGQIEGALSTAQNKSAKLSACIVMACALQPGGCKNQVNPNGPGGPNPSPTKSSAIIGNNGPGNSTNPGGSTSGDDSGGMGASTGLGTGSGAGAGFSPNFGLNPDAGENSLSNPIGGASGVDSREITYVDQKPYSNLTAKEKAARTATEERIKEITSAFDRNMDNPLRALREMNQNMTDAQLGSFQKAVDAVTPEKEKKYSLGVGDSTQASQNSSSPGGDGGWGSGGGSGSGSSVDSISGTLDLSGSYSRKLASVAGFENGIHTSRARTIFEIVTDQYESQIKQGNVRLKTARKKSAKSGSISR